MCDQREGANPKEKLQSNIFEPQENLCAIVMNRGEHLDGPMMNCKQLQLELIWLGLQCKLHTNKVISQNVMLCKMTCPQERMPTMKMNP